MVADDIARIVERNGLLPKGQYGGRSGQMTTDAVHVLEDKIKAAWRQGKVASVLFLEEQWTPFKLTGSTSRSDDDETPRD